jgi:hypothetical protein
VSGTWNDVFGQSGQAIAVGQCYELLAVLEQERMKLTSKWKKKNFITRRT